jgi:hypothetical protein
MAGSCAPFRIRLHARWAARLPLKCKMMGAMKRPKKMTRRDIRSVCVRVARGEKCVCESGVWGKGGGALSLRWRQLPRRAWGSRACQ